MGSVRDELQEDIACYDYNELIVSLGLSLKPELKILYPTLNVLNHLYRNVPSNGLGLKN